MTGWAILGAAAVAVFYFLIRRPGTSESGRVARSAEHGKSSDAQIVADFSSFLTNRPVIGVEFYDILDLPHPKQEILAAIERQIIDEQSDARVDALVVATQLLSQFQEGVGFKPVSIIGADLAKLNGTLPDTQKQMKFLASDPEVLKQRLKAERLATVQKEEDASIARRVNAALNLRNARR
jgi:hypothetical protein